MLLLVHMGLLRMECMNLQLLLSTGHCHQQSYLVFVMEYCSKRRIWIRANIIDGYTGFAHKVPSAHKVGGLHIM